MGFLSNKIWVRIFLGHLVKGIKACCAQAFATVLAIPSEISEEQCLKRIPELVRNRTVLLDMEVTTHVPR